MSELRFVYKHFRPMETLYEGAIFPAWAKDVDRRFRERCGGYVFHYQRGETAWIPNTHGGLTACMIYDGDDMVAHAEAECSIKDAFCYHIGREIAKGRALKKLEETNAG